MGGGDGRIQRDVFLFVIEQQRLPNLVSLGAKSAAAVASVSNSLKVFTPFQSFVIALTTHRSM